MANGFNPFTAVGGALSDFGGSLRDYLRGPLGRREALLEQQAQQLNPLREQLLGQLTQQQAFSGGPANEFASMVNAPQRVQSVQQPSGAQTTPLPPQQPMQSVPQELVPPPQIDQLIQGAANKYGVPANALRAIAAQESRFRPDAVNQPTPGDPTDPGAFGLFQFTEESAQRFGIDPSDPAQSADAAARMLRENLDRGMSLEDAITAHHGGPSRNNWGPNTADFRQKVLSNFQQLEQALPSGGQRGQGGPTSQPAPGMPGSEQLGPGESVGPFGTRSSPSAEQQSPVAGILAGYARDPRAFAEAFASPQGMQQLLGAFSGGGEGAFTLSPGQTRFTATGQPIAQGQPEAREAGARVVSGDTPLGQQLGIPSGERARAVPKINEAGIVYDYDVKGRFGGAGQDINIEVSGESFETQRGKDVAKQIQTRAESAGAAQSMISRSGRAVELLQQGTQTGRGQRLLLPIRQLAADFGVNIDDVARKVGVNISEDNLANQEEFNRLTTQMLIDTFSSFKGNLNQKEVELAQDSVPNMGTGEEANMRGLAFMSAAAEIALEDARRASQVETFDDAREYQRWRNNRDPQELQRRFKQQLEQFQARTREAVTGQPAPQREPAVEDRGQVAPSAPQPGVIEDGYRFRGGDPADPNNWERAQ